MLVLLLNVFVEGAGFSENIEYPLEKGFIDVIIPSVEKDVRILNHAIRGIRKNGKDIRRVIVVSKNRLSWEAEWFSEENYPFTKLDVAFALFQGDKQAASNYISHPDNRIGWIYQQLIKLYAYQVVPDLSNNLLILDSDTVFIRPTEFQNEDGWPLFNVSDEYHIPYFVHAAKLVPGLSKVFKEFSGITHHMLYQRPVLEDLFSIVEATHSRPFWEVFCQKIDKTQHFFSGASEYEIYFNFFVARSPQYKIRKLRSIDGQYKDLNKHFKLRFFDYVSYHAFKQTT